MSVRTKAILAILGASFLWATAGVSKVLVHTFDPSTAAFLRFAAASLVVLPFFLKERRTRQSIVPLVPIALASTANIAFFYVGLKSSTANAATIIYAATPLVTTIIAKWLIREEVTRRKLLGVVVGLAGALLTAILPLVERGQYISGGLPGNLFFAAAVLSWALYTIGSRYATATKRYSPLTVSAISIFTSGLVFGITTTFSWQPHYTAALVSPMNIFLILHLGILVTVATYLLYQWAIRYSSATTASLNTYLQPVFAVGFNVLFLDESLTPGFIVGSILVFAGVFIASGESLLQEIKQWFKIGGKAIF